jgi:hypothetical protein
MIVPRLPAKRVTINPEGGIVFLITQFIAHLSFDISMRELHCRSVGVLRRAPLPNQRKAINISILATEHQSQIRYWAFAPVAQSRPT